MMYQLEHRLRQYEADNLGFLQRQTCAHTHSHPSHITSSLRETYSYQTSEENSVTDFVPGLGTLGAWQAEGGLSKSSTLRLAGNDGGQGV